MCQNKRSLLDVYIVMQSVVGDIMELYQWQKSVIDNYKGNGVVKAVTGSGKSQVGVELAKKIGGHILVASHSKTILDQWRVDMIGIPNVHFETFQILYKKEYEHKVSLLIIDEVELSTSEMFIRLYDNIKYDNIIGLSATPNHKSLEKCGDILVDVGMSEANVSPFLVEFHGINLDYVETNEFKRLSKRIQKLMEKQNDHVLSIDDKNLLESLIFSRRKLVYLAKERLPYALSLIRENASNGHKIIVFCQRKSQADEISDKLSDIEHVLYHSGHKGNLNLFKENKVKLLISVKSVKEGFNDIDADCGIVVSTTLSERYNIQVIGRVIRFKDNKFAKMHILLANGTTDMTVLRYKGRYDFVLNESLRLPIISEHKIDYYKGKKFSFLNKDIWYKANGGGRQYMIYNPIIEKLRKIKPMGGSFTVSEEGVFTRNGREIIKISDEIPDLEEDENRKPIDWNREWSKEDNDEFFDRICGGKK